MLPVAVTVKARGADVTVVGEQPKDKFAGIRHDCYEALVKVAKQLSKCPCLLLSRLCTRKQNNGLRQLRSFAAGHLQLRHGVPQRNAPGDRRPTTYKPGGTAQDPPVHRLQVDAVQCH